MFSQPVPAATEWYVAIGQAQVGPLPLGEVKKKWEAGDVGPDSLVWRPGMGDWAPLTTVSELAGFLAPVARPASRGAARPAPEAPKAEPQPAPAAEVSWKPVGASALAALASAEIASRAPEARPAPARPAAKSLVDALPDGGGVDPTGALPLAIKGLESTGEKRIQRRSSVARGAEKVRHRRSATRALVVGIGAGVVLVAAGGAAAFYLGWIGPSRSQTVAARIASIPLPPPPVLPSAATPPATPQPAPPPATPPAVAAAQPPPAAPAPEPKHAAAEPKPERHAAAPRPPKTESPPSKREPQQRVAAAQPPAPDAKPPKKGGDSILDFDSGGSDSALDDALGGGSAPAGKRSVYVPPARAGGGTLPDKVSPGEINGAVAQRIEALRKCVSEQKAREPDATGTLKMRWIILPDGGVRDVKCVTPEYAQGQFASCLGGVVKSIRFPRSTTTGQEVTFPFNF